MKKHFIIAAILITMIGTALPTTQVHATPIAILEIIKAGVKKVIKAIDLKIQRLQNKTIWLQNAQKVLEDEMSKLKLSEISDWAEKQRKLYDGYYQELWKVKNTITKYKLVRDIIKKQAEIVEEYQKAYQKFQQDKNFSPKEIEHIASIYTGILDQSTKNLDEVMLVINSFSTQMSDGKRLEIIGNAAGRINENLTDLRRFNQQNILLSLQRAKEKDDIESVQKLYGLPNSD